LQSQLFPVICFPFGSSKSASFWIFEGSINLISKKKWVCAWHTRTKCPGNKGKACYVYTGMHFRFLEVWI